MALGSVSCGGLRRGWSVLACTLAACGAARAQTVLNFDQMSYTLDGLSTPFSEWGSLTLDVTPTSQVQYLNLRVGTNPSSGWVLRDVPFVAREGVGIAQQDSFQFDLGGALGFARGTNMAGTNVPFGLSVSSAPTGLPALSGTMNIGAGSATYGRGAEEAGSFLDFAAGAIAGAAAAAAGKSHANFPNQECPLNQCTPASVSNSLQWLKAQNPTANWGALPVDLATMRTATRWKVPPRMFGCFIDPDPNRPAGERNAWWQDKDAYMRANGYPIMTTQTTSFADIVMAIMNGKDVELQGGWHTAAIVGITPLANGNYSIQVAHDTKQGAAGGTQVDTILWNATTMKFEGSPGFFNGSPFKYAVIEMVIPSPAGLTLVALAGGLAARRRRG